MFGNDGVSRSSHDLDISRQTKMKTALEIRIQLIEETIKSHPDLLQAYGRAQTKMAEKHMKNELLCMGAGL